MDDIRLAIKKSSPPGMVVQTLRTALTMHPKAARNIVKDLTRPLNDQKRFIRKFDNEHWKGSLIMSEMIRCDDNIALQRLKKADIVIFEIHGGGFRVGHSLAPKHKYPGPLNECTKALDYLTKDLGVSPSKIIFSGDSAGGALCLETLMRTYSPGILGGNLDSPRENFSMPLPAGILLSSPLVSAETTSESWRLFEKKDIVSAGLGKLIYKEYLGLPHVNIEDLPIMKLHHIRKNFERFLPKHVMVFVGDKEVLRDDILEFSKAVKDDGKHNIQLFQEHYAHDWFMIHEIIKKKDKAMIDKYDEMFVDFVVSAVDEAKLSASSPASSIIKETLDNKLSGKIISVNVSEPEINLKLDDTFDLFDKVEFPKPAQYKPNTILSEYTITTDTVSPTPLTT
ncbi:Alpha/Beta hydrolase protein [Thamnidium elegans]|nr:Alpha/Beta hydrolase protein [Thamnidium elegans]